jgi:predicted phosphate transport protein (TIGR00153 family)
MKFPVELQPKMKKFVACTLETVQAAGKALSELDELLESGFSGSEIELIENMIADLGRAEHETDQVQRDMQHTLFKFERDMNPIDVMFMYRIIESLGDIADYAQSVGNRMLYLIAK